MAIATITPTSYDAVATRPVGRRADDPRPAPRARRRVGWRGGFAVLLAVIVVGPALVDLLHAAAAGWRPLGDNAIIMQRALDVGGPGNPMVGMPSSFTVWANEPSFHPGPMVFWLFAPVAWLFGTGGIASLFVVAAVRISCAAGIVLIPLRLGGRRLAVAAGVAVAAPLVVAPALFEPLNAQVAAAPYALIPFLCWAVLARRVWAVPVLALVASFVVQADLAFVPMTGALLIPLVVAGLVRLRRQPRAVLRGHRQPIAATACVLAVCWILPVAEALGNRGGNLRSILDNTLQANVPSAGWAGVGSASVVLALAVIVAIAWWSRRSAWTERSLAAVGGAALVGYLATLFLQPATGEASGQQSALGPLVFLTFVVLGASIEVVRVRGGRSRRIGVAVTAVGLALCALLAAIRPTSLPYRSSYRAGEILAEELAHDLAAGGHHQVIIRNPGAFPVREVAITATTQLEAHGIDSYVADGLVPYLGQRRNAELVPGAPQVWIVDGRAPAPPVAGAVPIATWIPPDDHAKRLDHLDERIADVVADAGAVTLDEKADVVVPLMLRGWPDVAAAYAEDPASIVDAPPPVLEALYTTGLVQSPALPPDLFEALDGERASHPITAYLVA